MLNGVPGAISRKVVRSASLCSRSFVLMSPRDSFVPWIGTFGKSRSTYGRAPMWSSCACVMRMPFTLSRRSRRYRMSGMTMSMPSICSSGNMRPASITTMSSPCSIAIMFFPISPTPPSGMIRTGLAKERHLLRGLRLRRLGGRRGGTRRGLEELREGLEVLLQIRSQRGLVERGGGVEHREDRDAVLLSGASVDARDGFAGKELVHGVAAQGHDDLRAERREGSLEPDVAGGHLLRQRVTVLRRSVAHDVRDEDLAAVQADARQQLIQQL